MFVKVHSVIDLQVTDLEEAEQAAQLLNSGAADVLNRDFPHGEILNVHIAATGEMSAEEITAHGYDEEA